MLYRGKRVRERGRLPKGKFPKKGGRRLVSGLLALVLCLTLVPVIYADTVVTVTSWYAAGAFEENTLYWVDNNNEDGVRPGANTYQPSLWFRIDNGEWIELKGGEDSTLSGVGLSAMPKMTVADNGNNTYTVSVPTGVLPEAIETTTSDGYGGETSTESRVEWIMGPSEGVDGYSPVEVNNGNVSEYPSAGDNYGWYYVLEDEFNFRVQLRWGNLGGAEGIAEAIYNSFDFVVDTNYTASSLRRLLAEMKDQMKIEEDPDGDPDNPTSGTVTVSGLWKYNLDGSRINYSVEETREGDGKGDGRLDAADGIAAGALLVAGLITGSIYLSGRQGGTPTAPGSGTPTGQQEQVDGEKPCEHDWTVTYKTVHHDAVTHTENVPPVYEAKTSYHTVCNDCQQTIDGIADAHIKDTGHSGYSTNVPITGEVLVSEGFTREVTDSPAYDESVPDKLVCTLCGEEKPATAE